jgi:DNA-binding transcriptional ArsR family regulator
MLIFFFNIGNLDIAMNEREHGIISSVDDITLIASSVRQELVDTLGSLGGEAGVAELALQLGRPMDGLYYHLERLRDGGLVTELAALRNGERRFRLVSAPGQPLRIVYKPQQPGVVAALNKFAAQLLHIAGQDFTAALGAPEVCLEGPRRELWISRNKGWLSEQDLIEVNSLLLRLSDLTSQPSAPDRPHLASLAFALAPLRRRAKRRQPKASASTE